MHINTIALAQFRKSCYVGLAIVPSFGEVLLLSNICLGLNYSFSS